MRRFILPLAAGFVLGVSGAAMAGSVKADNDIVAARATGPQLLTDSQMDKVVAGVNFVTAQTQNATADMSNSLFTNGAAIDCVPSTTGVNHGFGVGGGTAGAGINSASAGTTCTY